MHQVVLLLMTRLVYAHDRDTIAIQKKHIIAYS